MMRRVLAVATAGVFVLAGQALAGETTAAQLSALKGDVKVSQGGKVAMAKAGVLKPGDRIIAGKGQASLAYADGCVVAIKPQSMATVTAQSPCAGGPGLITAGGSSAQVGDLTPTQIVVGFLAVGGLLVGIGSLVSNDDDTPPPVSP